MISPATVRQTSLMMSEIPRARRYRYLVRVMDELPADAVCRKCGYALTGLPENRCPECGTQFDPAERDTFQTRSERKLSLRVVISVAGCNFGCIVVLLVTEFALKRVEPLIEMGYMILMSPLCWQIFLFPIDQRWPLILVLVVANCAIWGLAIGYATVLVQRRRYGRQ